MSKAISSSVGQGAVNRNADVNTIQQLLNRVPLQWGGPNPLLKVDGWIGSKTNAAIRRFQEVQFKDVFQPDGKVDPGKMTLRRLNHIADATETPGGFFRVSAEPVGHVMQPSNMTCWAAAGTMLCGARDRVTYDIPTVLTRADLADPGYGYLALFKANQGLTPSHTGRYTRALKLKVAPPINFTVIGWRNRIAAHGALGVVGLSPFLHIRVVTALHGDGSSFGTFVTIRDPGEPFPYDELFINFAQMYESAATVDYQMDQIWHK